MQVKFNNIAVNSNVIFKTQNNASSLKATEPDKFELTAKTNYLADYKLYKSGNTIHLISFKALQDPTVKKNISIITRVKDPYNYRENIELSKSLNKGEKLKFKVNNSNGNIEIALPNGKIIGNLPDSINKQIGRFIKSKPSDFSFKLHEVIATKKQGPLNVLIDIEYMGENKSEVHKKLNSLLYKNSVTPDQVLHRILDYKKVLNGKEIGNQKILETQTALDTISDAIKNPKNQKILLIGHNKPDGDTIGCCMGLKAALDYMGKEKVDVAIDDVMAGYLRNAVDFTEIKKTPTFLKELNRGVDSKINEIGSKENFSANLAELYALKKVKNYYNENVQTLDPNEKYDLAIFLDVSTPTKVSLAIKEYAKNSKNVIYIDHHPFQNSEWSKEQNNNGINIDSIKKEHMFWSEPKVPANTMLVTILVNKLLPGLTDKFRDNYYIDSISRKEKSLIEKMAASLVLGTITDTQDYSININKSIEDEILPPNKKTGFAPAGLVDWLLNLTSGEVTKTSVMKKAKYKLPNHTTINDKKIAEEVAKDAAVFPDLGLAISKVHFKSMKDFLKEYNMNNPEINMRDIMEAYKYNQTANGLKHPGKSSNYQVDQKYENDKINIMIREEEVKGELNANFQVAKENSLGFSFRSQDGTNYAGVLATLFGGGGHASASGVSLSLPDLTAESKLIIKIDNKIENDMNKIYQVIKKNYENNYLNSIDSNAKIDVEISDNGLSIDTLMSNLTNEIRQNH